MADPAQPVLDPEPAARVGEPPRVSRPLPVWVVPVVAAVVLVVAGVVLMLLWRWVDTLALAEQRDKATAHLDTVKIAASILVAGGGVFALYLTARRQRTQEEELQVRRDELAQRDRAQTHTEQDATDRQITELFTKAVEQLGHEQAAVRLGGLYTLERLAQNHLEQRRPVVSVLCGYLRMPYLDPDEPNPDDEAQAAGAEPITAGQRRARHQEREVRLAIQRLLRDHAHNNPEPGTAPDPIYWGSTNPATDIDVDLTGATVINLDLSEQRLHPSTNFFGATFTGDADFFGATFTGDADFSKARFTGVAIFFSAKFTGDADLSSATFTGVADFSSATFTGVADFPRATFASDADFSGATFASDADFSGATFASDADFSDATFASDADLSGTTFTGDADLSGARFIGDADFSGAMFTGDADFLEVTFTGDTNFSRAMFTGYANVHRIRVRRTFGSVWPAGWELRPLPAEDAPSTEEGWGQLVPTERS